MMIFSILRKKILELFIGDELSTINNNISVINNNISLLTDKITMLEETTCRLNKENKDIISDVFRYFFISILNHESNVLPKDYISGSNIISGVFDDEQLNQSFTGLKILFDNKCCGYKSAEYSKADLYYIWGMRESRAQVETLCQAKKNNSNVIFLEDGFIRSIVPFAKKDIDEKYRLSFSYTMDSNSAYIDAYHVSNLEQILNSNLIFSDDELRRARLNMNRIINYKVSKYNHQEDTIPYKIAKSNRKKILVVDQSYGDMSIELGMANSNTFINMLKTAIAENQDSDIFIKIHPDVKASGTLRGYYSDYKEHDNIHVINDDVNPITLLNSVDVVYVCTSQMGFEALISGKKVKCFGMPFYAGWGVTEDYVKLTRRTQKRSVEEIFFAAYIMYTNYVDPFNGTKIEIEDAINKIIELRECYRMEDNENAY